MSEAKQDERDSQYEDLLNSNFKQQKLAAWRPVPTIASTTITFSIFGIIFIIIGVIVLIYSNKIVESSIRYDLLCAIDRECEIDLEIKQKMEKPVMVYYQLVNFYQNHRRYVKSKSNNQLSGKDLKVDEIKSDCDPVFLNEHIYKTVAIDEDKTPLNPKDPANPCGLIAKSLFNDTYTLNSNQKPEGFFINETGIAWQSDIDMKYKMPKEMEKKMWLNTTNEHFMVWMRPAGLPNFRKLWGRINEDLEPGTYKIKVNNFYPVSEFNGEKHFVLSTVNAFGGKNSFIGISYISVGGICLVMALLFFFGYKSHNKTE